MREDMNAYEAEKKLVYKGLVILAVVTIIEVIFSLFGKGHLGWKEAYYLTWVNYIVGFIIIVLSLYKAYYIVAYLMHLAFETKTLIRTILIQLLFFVFAFSILLYVVDILDFDRLYLLYLDMI